MSILTLASLLMAPAALGADQPAAVSLIGTCRFDPRTLLFEGTPLEQARCLLRKVEPLGIKKPQTIPPVIEALLREDDLPGPAHLAAALAAFPQPYQDYARAHAADPPSVTRQGLPLLYFVIHDTSEPFFGSAAFPRHLDTDPAVNSFAAYMDQTFGPQPVAHVFLSRGGQIWAGHEFAEGWRATKLESRMVGPAARGRFAHIETVQPRRYLPGFIDRSHTQGPRPGFSKAQYRQLAALYVYASARAHIWLIPAFHSNVDDGIPDAHDDPQNFELKKFAHALDQLNKQAKASRRQR